MLPKVYPKWELVYYYFRQWSSDGLLSKIHDYLLKAVRVSRGRELSPSLGLIDSQTVKTHSKTKEKWYDANKKINGRKRHIVTDTQGLILSIFIHEANIQDREGAKDVLKLLKYKYPRLQKILADQGYTGDELANWVKEKCGWDLEVVKKLKGESSFQVLPKRWIVERTFGWVSFQGRLLRDYETLIEVEIGMVHIAMIKIISKKIKYKI